MTILKGKLEQSEKAKSALKELETREERATKIDANKILKIEGGFNDKIRTLENKKHHAVNEIREKVAQKTITYHKGKEQYFEQISEFKTILNIINLEAEHQVNSLATPEVYRYDYLYNKNGGIEGDKQKLFYNPIASIADDDFKKVLVYLTKNDKPKNKFDLVILGNTIFVNRCSDNNPLKLPYTYGLNAHTDQCNCIFLVKSFSSKIEAVNYFEKHKKKLSKNILSMFTETEEQFNKVIAELKASEELQKAWRIASLKDKKEYYETQYSRGTETKEYKEICKELKKGGN